MDAGAVFLVLSAVCMTYLFLTRGLPKPPALEDEESLMNAGYSVKEARRELRAQRAEYRATINTRSNALRTAASVARLVKRLGR
jgi:hypothetical protein